MAVFSVLFSLPLFGTTYVIQENGKEVGRFEKKDGKEGQEIVGVEKTSTPEPSPAVMVPDQYEYWYLEGEVRDIVTKKALQSGSLTFITRAALYETPVSGTGKFRETIKVPRGAQQATLRIAPPEGYSDEIFSITEKNWIYYLENQKGRVCSHYLNLDKMIRGNIRNMIIYVFPKEYDYDGYCRYPKMDERLQKMKENT
jgi:hypothetical protein